MASAIIGCGRVTVGYGGTTPVPLLQAAIAADTSYSPEDHANWISPRGGLRLRNLTAHVVASTLSTDSTVVSRIGNADGAQAVTLTATTLGHFVDSTHQDDLSIADLVSARLVAGGTSPQGATIASVLAELQSIDRPTCYLLGASASSVIVANSLTRYFRCVGDLAYSGTNGATTEDLLELGLRIRASGWTKGILAGVRNLGASDVVVTLRVNAADTPCTFTIPNNGAPPGGPYPGDVFFGQDARAYLRSGDVVTFKVVTGSTDGIVFNTLGLMVESDSDLTEIAAGGLLGLSIGSASTSYMGILGTLYASADTDENRIRMPFATQVGRFRLTLSTSASGGNSATFTLRVNGTPTGLALTIPSGSAAGVYETPQVDLEDIAAGDLVDVEIVTTGAWSATVRAAALSLNYRPPFGRTAGVCGVSC